MKCIVNISGKTKATIEIEIEDISDMFSEENYPQVLYSTVWNFFKDNEWDDICCDKVEYYTDLVVCYVSVT